MARPNPTQVGALSGGQVEVQALEPLRYGGKRHEPGAMVPMSVKDAAALIASGAARSRADAEAAAHEAQQSGDDELRLSS